VLDITEVVQTVMEYKKALSREAIRNAMPRHEMYAYKQQAADELLELLNRVEATQRGTLDNG
jgi:hypothetical protein